MEYQKSIILNKFAKLIEIKRPVESFMYFISAYAILLYSYLYHDL